MLMRCIFYTNNRIEYPIYIFMKIFDLHNDALTGNGLSKSDDVIYAIWTTKLTCNNVYEIVKANKGKMLAIEDCGIFADEIELLLSSHDFMYVGLTWNESNALAGGAHSLTGLSAKGRQVIKLLNEKHITIDTAHLNEASFYDVMEYANKIICSHTCFYNVKKHIRNLTSDQISAIINKNGIIGLCLVNDFLGGNTVESVLRHIDWFLEHYGDDNLAIGTDFYGTASLPDGLNNYKSFDNLALAMIRRGYSDATIHKVFYENAASYFFGHK